MLRFRLEDFFDEYEHRLNLINLASSDALPWDMSVLDTDAFEEIARSSLSYPDPKRLLPLLESALAPPSGVGLMPTSGAAEAIALTMHEIAASCSERDCVVVLPSPSYGAFRGLASLLGLKVKQYDYRPSAGWRPDLDEMCCLAKECSAFIINNPHNPTGYVIPNEDLGQLSKILLSRGAVLVVDEVFRFPNETQSAIGLDPNVVVLGSLSKTHGLPGLRLGWLATHRDRLSRYRTLQQYLSLTLNSFSITVGSSVLKKLTRFDRAELVRTNRKIVKEWAGTLKERISISDPMGGTTVCLTADDRLSEDLVFEALLAAGVLLAPGNRCFEGGLTQTWFRLGYGTDTESLELGLTRLATVIHDQHNKVS
jgi:aspartate/methionine/tyrosine aminotransferase